MQFVFLLYLYRARNKITQFSILTHAQLQRHRLKFIKNHLKNSYMFRSSKNSVCNFISSHTIFDKLHLHV